MLRSALLYLSEQKQLRHFTETSPLARGLTSRFVAGMTLDSAIDVCARLQRECILITLDRLGESVTSLDEAAAARDGYIEAIRRISAMDPASTVSIKLTQFGLLISEAACRNNVLKLAGIAAQCGRKIEIDMESSDLVDRTLGIVLAVHEAHGNVRAVIQAYLRRSEKDVEMLCGRDIPIRLCKGAYKEPPAIAFPKKSEVDASYVRLMKTMLDRGRYPALATHDERIIEEAKRYAREKGIAREQFEFQMLYGIRRDLAKRFVADGYRIRLYVPYGDAWYPYFMRRLAERPANLFFLIRNFARG